MSTSSTSSEHETHELALYIRVARARACVLLLIMADALSVLAIIAGGGYLSALNTENQYRMPGDHPPNVPLGIVVAIALVLSGLAFYWWERKVRRGEGSGQQMFFILAWALMIVAVVIQILIGITLNRGYTTPYDAYESVIILLVWSMALRHLLAAILGLPLFGRIMRGRIAGYEYLVEASGYWWYYTVVASLLMWLFSLSLR
jgi:heme/copper-type cytochrome/quinol oxidase subunit 3